MSEGIKYDKDKLGWDLLPISAVTEIVKVLTFGAKKYASWNWAKGLSYSRLYASSQRHLNAWWEGEDKDPETGIHHLAHLGCCVLFLLTYCLKQKAYKAFDDRPFRSVEEFTKED